MSTETTTPEPPIGSRVRGRGAIWRRFEDGRWRVEEDTRTWFGLSRNGEVEVIETAEHQADPPAEVDVPDEGSIEADMREQVRRLYPTTLSDTMLAIEAARFVWIAAKHGAGRGPAPLSSPPPAGEAQEVPAGEVREGDTVTLVTKIAPDFRYSDGLGPDHIYVEGLSGFPNSVTLTVESVTVTRPVPVSPPLPTEPGAVVRAAIVDVLLAGLDHADKSFVADLPRAVREQIADDIADRLFPLPAPAGVAVPDPAKEA